MREHALHGALDDPVGVGAQLVAHGDGLEATRLIKDRWPEVKIIVLTMYPSYRANTLAAGADAFLIKGCPAEELLEAVMDR